MSGSISFDSAIQNLNSLSTSLNQYVVTPLLDFGIGGFVFDIDGEARVELNNEITDHYVENNSVVQDHIAVKPKKITLRNYVGELTSPGLSSSGANTINKVAQKLTQLGAFLPALAAGATQAQSIYDQSQASVLSGNNLSGGALVSAGAGVTANLYALVKNLISAQSNKQQAAYQYFKAMRDTRQIFSIQTPFEFMTNMAIESIVAVQPEDSSFISHFAITLKEIRVAATNTSNVAAGQAAGIGQPAGGLTSSSNAGGVTAVANGQPPNPADLQGGLAQQAAPTINNGAIPGVSIPDANDPAIETELQNIQAIRAARATVLATGALPPGFVMPPNEHVPVNQ